MDLFYAGRSLNSHRVLNELRDDATEYLTIRNDPVTISDPTDKCIPVQNVRPKPYLRRGAGLERYNMSVDYFKKGPPELYRKDEFKSFLRSDQPKKKIPIAARCTSRSAPVPKPKEPYKASTKAALPRILPERKYAMSAGKCFDDEVIPTLRIGMSEEFHVPFVPAMPARKNEESAFRIPKTPMKKLVLKPMQQAHDLEFGEEGRQVQPFESEHSDNDGDDDPSDCESVNSVSPAARRLEYNEPLPNRNVPKNFPTRTERENQQCSESISRTQIETDNMETRYKRTSNQVMIEESGENKDERRSAYEIAQAMKRKGLTDNVKKHLGWNVTPRRRRPLCIVKKLKIKKPRPVVKREKFTLHELKEKLVRLEEEKTKFQIENYRIKRLEKDYVDEKLKLDKVRRDMENTFKDERKCLEEEKQQILDEHKKLKREKAAFNRFCQETRNLPSRDEREEIRNLKEELMKFKEIQKTKEARIGAAQAQMRNRIAYLEKENSELKKDLEMAQRVSAAVNSKKVRFEGRNVRTKVINAINDQLDVKLGTKLPNSARERESAPKPVLRRTKSAVELKPPKGADGGRKRGVSSGAVSVTQVSTETSTSPSCNGIGPFGPGEDEEPSNHEVIDLVGDDDVMKKDDCCDSGMGSGYSDNSFRSTQPPEIAATKEIPVSYASINEIKRRVGSLLGLNDKVTTNFCSVSNDYLKTNGAYTHADDMPKLDRLREKNQTVEPDARGVPAHEINCSGCVPDHWNGMPTSHRFQHANPFLRETCEPTLNISNVSQPEPVPTARTNDSNICARHGIPVKSKMVGKDGSPSSVPARDVIRTELPCGDVEEEELHTGVRRVWCAACGSVETTYRTRPGYRRTTTPLGDTVEEHSDGIRELRKKTGEFVRKYPNGDKLLIMTNGDREFTTRGYKKLETANGTVKYLYDDGRQKTQYPSGRIRIKDKTGYLIMDTGGLTS